jgi:Flp pilus assembly protein TadB
MMSEMAFLASLVCVALIIFLLSVILAAIDRNETENSRESDNEDTTSNNQGTHANTEQLVATIANEIHTYRCYRQSNEGHRAKREKTTIILLGFTAIFPLVAAGSAIYSAWIFYDQLDMMRTERRAWVGPVSGLFSSLR